MSNDFLVDFQEYGLEVENTFTVSKDTVKALGDKVVNAFKNYGFCYLKNHGVDEELLKDYMDVSRAFFEKPTECKAKYPLRYDYRKNSKIWDTSNNCHICPKNRKV